METAAKLARLKADLALLPGALVCFSGGVDSSFLLAVAAEALPGRTRALIAVSASMPEEEAAAALALADALGVPTEVVESQELEDPRYVANRGDRCYWCKSELFRLARERAEGAPVLDGTNLDDLADHRPGHQA